LLDLQTTLYFNEPTGFIITRSRSLPRGVVKSYHPVMRCS